MRYYLIEIIQYNDGTKESPSIYSYDSLDAAVSKFHKELGGWGYGQKENVKHVLCMVINSEGGIYENKSWTAPEVEESEIPVEE